MMTPTLLETQYYYPNRMGRVILLAMETAMGRHKLDEVLAAADLESF